MNRSIARLGAAGLMVMASGAAAYAQQALGTAFTYQGRLDQSGSPVDATADFQFSLFDAASSGNLVAGPVSVSNVAVADGLFTASIDFGAAAFNGQARWLSVAARSPAGSGTFTTLSPRQKLTGTPYALKVPGIDGFSLDAADGSPLDALFVDNAGNVGIGITNPSGKVDIQASDNNNVLFGRRTGGGLTHNLFIDGAGNGSMQLRDSSGTTRVSLVSGNFSYFNYGNVGIGTATPAHQLSIGGGSSPIPKFALYEEAGGVNAYGFGVSPGALTTWTVGAERMRVTSDGQVGIGTTTPQATLDVNGTTRTSVLEITGADLAEKFPASEKLDPGMVVAIDPKNPGKMCLARGAYNRCVAGVVSGANDFAAGAVLGNMPGSEDAPPIALSGRVYVHCDAAGAPIQPGDLLTTSDTPGHAMKVVDYPRAQGAIIGKAMTALESGRGMVLVLVNLQ